MREIVGILATEAGGRAGFNVTLGNSRRAGRRAIGRPSARSRPFFMSLKIIAAALPVFLLMLSAWRFSQPMAGEAKAAGGAPVAMLEEAEVAGYEAFDLERTFVLPAGPKGLEYSAEAKRLEGRRVRIGGSMVRHAHDDAAIFLLTTHPMVLNMQEYGLADDLPANAVHVILPVVAGVAPDWVRQPLVVYGRLELGGRQELDGRLSQVRLIAEHVTAADGRTAIELRRSVLRQPARVKAGKVQRQTLSALRTD